MIRCISFLASLALIVGWVGCPIPGTRADQTITPSETVIQLHVHPMAAPKPALRYQLLPELSELSPGNPIPNYLRCVMDQDSSSEREVFGKSALRMVDQAARMDKPDWQILIKLKTDGFSLLLPDLQKMRSLASALQTRFQEEVTLHHFDDALTTAKTMFAMSRHMAEHPTLIGDLVAIAMTMVVISPLEEMLQQPGCPNLFWALTNLPSPLVSLDKGMQGERVLMLGELRDLDENVPMTPGQLRKLINHIDELRRFASDNPKKKQPTQGWLNERTKNQELIRAARNRLIESGIPEERLLRFPPEQVILLDEKLSFEIRRDEVLKLMNLPAWEFSSRLPAFAKTNKEEGLFGSLGVAFQKVRQAQTRLELRIAMLRHVEALRLYAAEHGGQMPKKLTDVPIPLPVDPFTGQSIRYALEGATAHLRGGLPDGVEPSRPDLHVHYLVTMEK